MNSRAGRRARWLMMTAALAAALTGCAARQKAATSEVVWPLPPDKPRIRYVRTLTGSSDLEAGVLSGIRKGILGSSGEAMKNPNSVALSPDDRHLYVACSVKGLVLDFDFGRGEVTRIANEERASARAPFGVAVDAAGSVYVSDQAEKAVWVYAPGGAYLRQIGKGLLDRPTGLAIDRRRQILYVVEGGRRDSTRHAVEVFALDGRHLRTIGTAGASPGQFFFPAYAAVAPNGNLYVADTLNTRIQVFDPDGELVTLFGTAGSNPGAFAKLKGLAFDSLGNLHAVDGQNAYVQIFNPENQLLMAYGGRFAPKEYMLLPTGIAIDSKNNIYVADLQGDRVNQYVLFDTTAADPPAPAPPTAAPAGK